MIKRTIPQTSELFFRIQPLYFRPTSISYIVLHVEELRVVRGQVLHQRARPTQHRQVEHVPTTDVLRTVVLPS